MGVHKDPEYKRKWAERNREKIREQRARTYQENRETLIERSRANYAANRDARAAQQREYKNRDPERWRAYNRDKYWEDRDQRLARDAFTRHGIRPEDWAAIWDSQDGRCYLCGTDLAKLNPRYVHVDHDHRCCPKNRSCPACRRGLACMDCNIAIGHAGDDPGRLRRMADALEAVQVAVGQRIAAAGEQLTLTD